MKPKKELEQQIAVFGEGGSGKTVLLSSWYGRAQEPSFRKENLYRVECEDYSKGTRLYQNYLGMKNSDELPMPTQFASTSYAFKITPNDSSSEQAKKYDFDSLRLVWHDYPGEWFTNGAEGEEEQQRRVDTFRALLGSDLAMLLVDGQRLKDNAGQEASYLKALFNNYLRGLEALRENLMEGNEKLAHFPRIWVIALSKADLLPDLDVQSFRELVIEKSGAELGELSERIGSMLTEPRATAIGQDFILLSSAKFSPEDIDVTTTKGLPVILPMAATLPLEKFAAWRSDSLMSRKLFEDRVAKALESILPALRTYAPDIVKVVATRLPGPLKLAMLANWESVFEGISKFLNARLEDLREAQEAAINDGDVLAAIIAGFGVNLAEAKEQNVYFEGGE